MDLSTYLRAAGIEACVELEANTAGGAALFALEAARARGDAASDAARMTYRVPEVSPDGSCSLPDRLQPEPYDLRNWQELDSAEWVARIGLFGRFLEELNVRLGADWLGIYRRMVRRDGVPVLLKLAYLGTPSRAEFPLTEEFLGRSTNTRVGVLGKAVVIADVETHARSGGAYYSCDAQVRSELCVPVFRPNSRMEVCGIIDAESFRPGHFDRRRTLMLAAAACEAGRLLAA